NANITYTLTATNAGPNVSTGTTVTDVLPPDTTFVSATATQGTCTVAFGCTCPQSSGTVTCALGGLPVGGTATITIVATPKLSASGGTLQNPATISGNETDPNTADNTSTTTTGGATVADLALTQTGNAAIVAGTDHTYTLTATNNGPSTAT